MATTRKRRRSLLGESAVVQRIQPKLRMVANGDDDVNGVRAEQCSSIAVAATEPELRGTPMQRQAGTRAPANRRKAKRPSLKRLPGQVIASVFVHASTDVEDVGAPEAPRRGKKKAPAPEKAEDVLRELEVPAYRKGTIVAARVKLGALPRLAAASDVRYVELAESLASPSPAVSRSRVPEPSSRLRRFGDPRRHRDGQDVLVGIVDVGGFDFAHPDFLDRAGRTRFSVIWDQGGSAHPSPGGRFDYGALLTAEQMNRAIQYARRTPGSPPPTLLEPQSEMVEGSHGTHVASVAAGGRGVCRAAEIAAVLVSSTVQDRDRRQTFFDSRMLVDAVDFLIDHARQRKKKAITINISLGTNGHAHDGTSAACRWIESVLATPGRAICVAAGNAGQEAAEFEGDMGYVMGRIHTSGKVPAAGLHRDLSWVVAGDTVEDISENELEIWYSAQDRFAVSVRPPGSRTWLGPVAPRSYMENRQLPDRTLVSIYNDLYHPANGTNHIAIYLSPYMRPHNVIGVKAGEWTVRLTGLEIRDGAFHGWIERDDPIERGQIGDRRYWSFPSFFASGSNVDDSSISSLACGRRVISVANYDGGRGRIHVTSSQGPTRDARFKPDVAADGTEVVAAKGFSTDGELWVSMTGTSMASPLVTGVVGLMLNVKPNLSAPQIESILRRSARPLPGTDYAWANDAGFGLIDPDACLEETEQLNLDPLDVTKS